MPTNFRSAVGAQEPRTIVFLDTVTIAYTDSGGSGPTVISLHAIGHGARDFENLTSHCFWRLQPTDQGNVWH